MAIVIFFLAIQTRSCILLCMDANNTNHDEVNAFAKLSALELAEYDRWLDEVMENNEMP